ncbi:MAG: hypothetical protein Q7I99_04315 [Acholeplasmataceae bacterium]|nr:hypothetical protein [Acholeplasmataceae bacterium]
MKKLLLLVGVILTAVMLYGCTPDYTEEAGVYELYEMSGDINLSNFQYYTIELFADGSVLIQSRGSQVGSETYKAEATYRIKGDKITIITKVGFTNVKEVFEYVDGEIHMVNTEIPGYDMFFSAKFKRVE